MREREQAAREKQRAAEQREREREKTQQAREREAAKKEAARERALRDKEKQREREAAKKAAQKQREVEEKRKKLERERAARERTQLKKQRDRERAEAQKAREREAAKKKVEQKKLLLQREKERAAALKAKAAEKQRQAVEKERQRAEAKRLREQERVAQKAERLRLREEEKREREAERVRLLAEKEREREEARRIKEEERARKEAEREAYRKAKEAERERLRAEREAARRALESRVARATRNAQRAAARGSTTRVYRPDAIPNQSGTTRRVDGQMPRFGHFVGTPLTPPPATPPPAAPPEGELEYTEVAPEPGVPAEALDENAGVTGDAARVISEEEQRRLSLVERVAPEDQTDQRWASIQERLTRASDDFRREYRESFDMSWVYHDSALEGVVYTFQELKTAIDPNITVVPDSSLQPVCEEIRRHNAAIELVRELSEKKRVPITVDVVKRIYLTLHPEEGDLKSVKYRKDIPQHRLYFHEYAQPDKIAYKVRQVTDWLNGPEPKKLKNPVKIAARVHYDLLRTFPFPTDSGKVARLLSNLILMRSGYPPAIIHSTERQRYYEALKGSLQTIVNLTNEAIENGFQSIEKRLEDYEARARATV